LLSLAEDPSKKGQFDTLDEILAAPDCEILLEWLSTRPLLHYDAQLNYVMVHAGIAPQWDLAQAQLLATEVATVLQSRQRKNLLLHLYGDKPDIWSDALTDCSRWRCIINYFTRMRYCRPDGSLNLRHKENPANAPDNLMPWFKVPERKTEHQQIIFGHWASLAGFANTINVFALDTGCVWGEHLTALKLETQEIFSVESLQKSDDINNQ
jgi:bis(5'-nucleosyl)-tetraphosphatase (symmetrical)